MGGGRYYYSSAETRDTIAGGAWWRRLLVVVLAAADDGAAVGARIVTLTPVAYPGHRAGRTSGRRPILPYVGVHQPLVMRCLVRGGFHCVTQNADLLCTKPKQTAIS